MLQCCFLINSYPHFVFICVSLKRMLSTPTIKRCVVCFSTKVHVIVFGSGCKIKTVEKKQPYSKKNNNTNHGLYAISFNLELLLFIMTWPKNAFTQSTYLLIQKYH